MNIRENLHKLQEERNNVIDSWKEEFSWSDIESVSKITTFLLEKQNDNLLKISLHPEVVFTKDEMIRKSVVILMENLHNVNTKIIGEKVEIWRVIHDRRQQKIEMLKSQNQKHLSSVEKNKRIIDKLMSRSWNSTKESVIKQTPNVIDQTSTTENIDNTITVESTPSQPTLLTSSDGDVKDFLNFVTHIEEILDFDFYPPNPESTTNIYGENVNADKHFEKKLKTAEKFKICMEILRDMWAIIIDKIYCEQENESRMRVIPYKIIYVEVLGRIKTIAISNEIWQATFVYDGHVLLEKFHISYRFQNKEDINVAQLYYSDVYWDKLEKMLTSHFQDPTQVSAFYKQTVVS